MNVPRTPPSDEPGEPKLGEKDSKNCVGFIEANIRACLNGMPHISGAAEPHCSMYSGFEVKTGDEMHVWHGFESRIN